MATHDEKIYRQKEGWDAKLEERAQQQANADLHQGAFDVMQNRTNGHDYADLSKIRDALDRGADVNAVNDRGQTALHMTLNAHAAKMLLEAGADPLALDKEGLLPSQARLISTGEITHKAGGVDWIVEAAAKERQAQQLENKAPEKAPPVHEHQKMFDTFNEQVTAPRQQHEPTPLEQAQQARAPSLGGAAVSQKVELPDFRKQEAQARDPSALSQKVSLPDFRKEPERDQQKGARFLDLPLPRSQAQEPTAGDAFNADTTRRASARMAPTLGQATIAAGMTPSPAQEQDAQGQQGKEQGGRERPSDPSYYTQFSQSVSLPKRDEQAAEKQAARRAVDRDRSRGLGGRGI